MDARARMYRGARLSVWALVLGAVLVFIAANSHLVYVAFTSDPGCVTHLKDPGAQPGQFRAAKSSC